MSSEQRIRDYADADGVRTYYEIVGEGEPVVLLHGGMCTIDTWGPQIPALASKYRLIMPERRGHGRSPDVAGPVTYEAMAADTIAFMTALRIGPAHLVGWSDGAFTALLVAMARPDLVKKLAYISDPINHTGISPKFRAMAANPSREHLPPWLEAAYAAVSPDGADHYPIIADKMTALWKQDHAMPVARLRALTMPTLVMIGDDDMHSVAHAAEMLDALRDGQLAVVPGTSHALAMEKPEIVNRILLDFLEVQQTTKLFTAGE